MKPPVFVGRTALAEKPLSSASENNEKGRDGNEPPGPSKSHGTIRRQHSTQVRSINAKQTAYRLPVLAPDAPPRPEFIQQSPAPRPIVAPPAASPYKLLPSGLQPIGAATPIAPAKLSRALGLGLTADRPITADPPFPSIKPPEPLAPIRTTPQGGLLDRGEGYGLKDQPYRIAPAPTTPSQPGRADYLKEIEAEGKQLVEVKDQQSKARDAAKALMEIERQEREAKEKLTTATATELALDRQRVEASDKITAAMRNQLAASGRLSDGFRSVGSVLSNLIRGNVVGAMEAGTGFLQRRASSTIAGRDQQTATAGRAIDERSKLLAKPPIEAVAQHLPPEQARGLPLAQVIPGSHGIPTTAPAPIAPAPMPIAPTASAPTATPFAGSAAPSTSIAPAGKAFAPALPAGGGAAAGEAGGLAGAAGAVGVALAGVATVATGAVSAISAVGSAMVSMAAKASPAAFERFQIATEDAQAVLGRVFVPVLELATEGIRTVGDVLAEILPSSKEMREALAPLQDAFTQIKDSIAPLIPYLKGAVTGFIAVGAKIAEFTAKTLANFFKWVGMYEEGSSKAFAGKSLGASAQPAQFMDVKSYLRQSYEKAASMGAEGKTPEEHLSKLPDILETAKDILKFMTDFGKTKSELYGYPATMGANQNDVHDMGFAKTFNLAVEGWVRDLTGINLRPSGM